MLMLQKSLGALLLVVLHIDVPDTPRAIFGGCHHLSDDMCQQPGMVSDSCDPGAKATSQGQYAGFGIAGCMYYNAN